MRGPFLLLVGATFALGCNTKADPFKPVPECKGPTVVPFMGDRQMVVSALAIADANEGFDLDKNGTIDNKLSALGALANTQITATFMKAHSIVIPIELWGYMGETNDACTKLAFYVGKFNKDRDGDGKDTTWDLSGMFPAGDCLDTDPNVRPNTDETGARASNRLDDDCDGFADNATKGQKPSGALADMDLDGDGYSLSMGDCDDRNDATNLALAKSRHPGAKDICDDGIDQDCDGIPDNDPSCDPFKMNDVKVQVTQMSFDPSNNPLITFKDGFVTNNQFTAGPDLFNFSAPFQNININLLLSGAHLQMDLADNTSQKLTTASNGLLGGVIEAVTMGQITGISAGTFIKPDQSLLDAIMLGGIAGVLGLDVDKDNHPLVDIDVDGDGIETFWQATPTPGMSAHVDTCKDGDGTIITSTPTAPCVLAKDAKGNYRFVDGLSIALKFSAVPAKIDPMIIPK
ncbi:MAG TPA: putative metal-binding motif-containing protein [Polyangia bacterium]|nr:putative metal-binding motif-containing protein [Polyangia bacterium]